MDNFFIGSKNWTYKYQGNGKKTTFSNGIKKQHDYGLPFQSKSTIGCGWNKEEKIIYFTKDGIDLGPAFVNVTLGRVVPAVGISKGVHVFVNFGQEPFKFKQVLCL